MDQTRTFLLGQMAGAKTLEDYHLAFLALQRLENLLVERSNIQGLGAQMAYGQQRFQEHYRPTTIHNEHLPRTRPAPAPQAPASYFEARPLGPEFTRPVPQVRDDLAPDFDSIEVPGEEFTYNP